MRVELDPNNPAEVQAALTLFTALTGGVPTPPHVQPGPAAHHAPAPPPAAPGGYAPPPAAPGGYAPPPAAPGGYAPPPAPAAPTQADFQAAVGAHATAKGAPSAKAVMAAHGFSKSSEVPSTHYATLIAALAV